MMPHAPARARTYRIGVSVTAMKRLAITALVFVQSTAFAEPTKTVLDRTGKCQVTVPADWKGNASLAISPDRNVTIGISSPRVDSFDMAKAAAKEVNKDSKVTKDSADEFEMEGNKHVYRAIPVGSKTFCSADVQYKAGTVDDARKLVRTLAGKQ